LHKRDVGSELADFVDSANSEPASPRFPLS